MAIRDDSYGSVAEVQAYTAHLLDGESAFNSTTRPTSTQVEKFIDRASSYVNLALETHGFTSPLTNSTAVLMMDDWVVNKATEFVELTQRGAGYSGEEGSRTGAFANLAGEASRFVKENELGLKRIGATVGHRKSEGLAFTGLDDQDERDDPDNADLEQPMFRRGQFSAVDNDVGEEGYY